MFFVAQNQKFTQVLIENINFGVELNPTEILRVQSQCLSAFQQASYDNIYSLQKESKQNHLNIKNKMFLCNQNEQVVRNDSPKQFGCVFQS